MRRRFVIGADPLTPSQGKQLREYLAKGDGLWWNWIHNLWLYTTKDSEVSAEKITDFILGLNSDARIIVLEFPADIDWVTSGSTNAQGKHISDWLKDIWKND